MNDNCSINQIFIKKLQNEARDFLTSKKMLLERVSILPKEVESYCFNEDEFKDNSVHRNDLQKNNANHFYIHRWGYSKLDSYKGGNYAGIDFVVSNNPNVYYSFLIRSAVINDKLVIGPHKVLLEIANASGLSYGEIESKTVSLVPNKISQDVLFSHRINLGKTVPDVYRNCDLRAVLCDEFFRESKYLLKENMIVDFLIDKMVRCEMTREQALNYAKLRIGYIPSILKKYDCR